MLLGNVDLIVSQIDLALNLGYVVVYLLLGQLVLDQLRDGAKIYKIILAFIAFFGLYLYQFFHKAEILFITLGFLGDKIVLIGIAV